MKKLHVFILKSFLGPFSMTFFIALFVLLMQFIWKYIDDLVGKGLEFSIIAKLLFYTSSTFIPMALPLAVLLSSLMTFGNLGEKYELTACKSAGISLNKVMRPLIIAIVIISISDFLFSNYVLPVANLKMKTLLNDVRQQKPAVNIQEGVNYKEIENYVIRIGKKDKDGKTIHNVIIYDHTERMGNTNLTIAKSGKMEMTDNKRYLIFTLYDGSNYYENVKSQNRNSKRPMRRTKFKEEYRYFDLSSFALKRTDEAFYKNNYQMLNIKQLQYSIDSLYIIQDEYSIGYKKYFKEQFHQMPINIDSSYSNRTKDSIQVASLASLNTRKKNDILRNASGKARSTKNQIFFRSNNLLNKVKYINRYAIELHRKFSMSFACLVLFFLGAPLGAIIRKGGLGLPLVISVILFVFFHILSITGEKLVRDSHLEAYEGMWIASIVFLPFGIYLSIKAAADAPILDMDIWKRILEKINIYGSISKYISKNSSTQSF